MHKRTWACIKPDGDGCDGTCIPPLVCGGHPILRDEMCPTCWEAKDRNEKIAQRGRNAEQNKEL